MVTFAASVSRGVHSGSPTSESSIRKAGSTDKVFGASEAAVWVAETGGGSINAQTEAGSIDGLQSLSGEDPCEMTGNNSGCPNGAGDWCGIVVAEDGVDGLLIEYGRLPCSRDSETGFVVSTERKRRGFSSTVGMQR